MARPSPTVLAIGLSRKTCLPASRRGPGGFQMRVVGRGVDDCFDRAVVQDLLVAGSGTAIVLGGKGAALVLGAREAGNQLELRRSLDGVGQHVRPPAHSQCGHAQRRPVHDTSFSPSFIASNSAVGRRQSGFAGLATADAELPNVSWTEGSGSGLAASCQPHRLGRARAPVLNQRRRERDSQAEHASPTPCGSLARCASCFLTPLRLIGDRRVAVTEDPGKALQNQQQTDDHAITIRADWSAKVAYEPPEMVRAMRNFSSSRSPSTSASSSGAIS